MRCTLCFAMFFLTRGLNWIVNSVVFFIFFFQVSKQTNQKHWYLQCFDKTTGKKKTFKQFFTIFQLVLFNSKINHCFTLSLPRLIRTQEGVKSEQVAKLHLKSTFCLSQSLPQRCNTRNFGRLSGPQNAVNYSVL